MASPATVFNEIQSSYSRASSARRAKLEFLMSLAADVFARFEAGQLSEAEATSELEGHLTNMRRRAGVGQQEAMVIEGALKSIREKINAHPSTKRYLEAKASGRGVSSQKAAYESLEDLWSEAAQAAADFNENQITFEQAKGRIDHVLGAVVASSPSLPKGPSPKKSTSTAREAIPRIPVRTQYGPFSIEWVKGDHGSWLVKAHHPSEDIGTSGVLRVVKEPGTGGSYLVDDEPGFSESYKTLAELKKQVGGLVEHNLRSNWGSIVDEPEYLPTRTSAKKPSAKKPSAKKPSAKKPSAKSHSLVYQPDEPYSREAFENVVSRLADLVFERIMQDPSRRVFVRYTAPGPGTLWSAFIVHREGEEIPAKSAPLTPQAVPGESTRDQIRAWLLPLMGNSPILPIGDKKPSPKKPSPKKPSPKKPSPKKPSPKKPSLLEFDNDHVLSRAGDQWLITDYEGNTVGRPFDRKADAMAAWATLTGAPPAKKPSAKKPSPKAPSSINLDDVFAESRSLNTPEVKERFKAEVAEWFSDKDKISDQGAKNLFFSGIGALYRSIGFADSVKAGIFEEVPDKPGYYRLTDAGKALVGTPSAKKPSAKKPSAPAKAPSGIIPGIPPRAAKVNLVGVGPYEAIPAAYLTTGDITVWDHGMAGEVLKIEQAGRSVKLVLSMDTAAKGEHKVTKRVPKDQLVAVVGATYDRVLDLVESTAKRPSAKKRQSAAAALVNRPLARHLVDQFNNALAPLFKGYYFRAYEDRGAGGVGVAVEAALAAPTATKQEALEAPVVVGLFMEGLPGPGKQWLVGEPAPGMVQAFARTFVVFPHLARAMRFNKYEGLAQRAASEIINYFRRNAARIKSTLPPVKIGEPMRYMEGFALKHPSGLHCIGPRKMAEKIEAVLPTHIVQGNPEFVTTLADRLTQMANMDRTWTDEQLAGTIEAVARDTNADVSGMTKEVRRGRARSSEETSVIELLTGDVLRRSSTGNDRYRFVCEPPPMPTNGDVLEQIEWALKASYADPRLARSLIERLDLIETREVGSFDPSDLDELLDGWAAAIERAGYSTTGGQDAWLPDMEEFATHLHESLVLFMIPGKHIQVNPESLFYPDASRSRTPQGAIEFFRDEIKAFESGQRASDFRLNLDKESDRSEYEYHSDVWRKSFEMAIEYYVKLAHSAPWKASSAPKKPSAKKPSAKKPSAKKPSAKKPSAKKPSAIKREDLFTAKNVPQLFELMTQWLGRRPTEGELRDYTNLVLGPCAIPHEISEMCRRPSSPKRPSPAKAPSPKKPGRSLPFMPRAGMVLEDGWVIRKVSPNAKRVTIYLPSTHDLGYKVSKPLTYTWDDNMGTWKRQGEAMPGTKAAVKAPSKRPSPAKAPSKRPSPAKAPSKRPSPAKAKKLHIAGPGAFRVLAELEGTTWAKRQEERGAKLDNGFFLNLLVFTVLSKQGLVSASIPLSELDPSAGVILGASGALYIVMPDGEIMLDGASVAMDKRVKAAKVMQVIEP